MEELLLIMSKLQEAGMIRFDQATGWLWVKVWWKHNSLAGAFSGKLTVRSVEQVSNVLVEWREEFVAWLKRHDSKKLLEKLVVLPEDPDGSGGKHDGAYDASSNAPSAGSVSNSIPNCISNPTPPRSPGGEGEEEYLLVLVDATIAERKEINEPVLDRKAWTAWALRKAEAGRRDHLYLGQTRLNRCAAVGAAARRAEESRANADLDGESMARALELFRQKGFQIATKVDTEAARQARCAGAPQ